MHATHQLDSQTQFEPPKETPIDNGVGTKNVEVETGSNDGADGSEIVGDDDGNQNSAENETEDKGVANEDTEAGGANKKDGNRRCLRPTGSAVDSNAQTFFRRAQ